MVEESTAGARNLSAETERLFEQLSFFELGQATSQVQPKSPVRKSMPAHRGNLALKTQEDEWEDF
jgi:hypothetical protein